MRPLPDLKPSELVDLVRRARAGEAIPDIPMVTAPVRPHKACQISCIVTNDEGVGEWCPQCPYAA